MHSIFRLVLTAYALLLTAQLAVADDSLEARLERYCSEADRFDRACQYNFVLSLQFFEDNKDPLFVEMIGRIARKNDAFYLRFDQRRRQERGALLLTYESGLRTPDVIKFAFGVTNPKPEVREIPQDRRRNRQFEENYYSLNPGYFPVETFLSLRIGDPFDKDSLMPLEKVSQTTLANGSEQFAYSAVPLGGGLVYELTFSNEVNWLPVEIKYYYHPLLADGVTEEFKQQLREIKVAEYKSWTLGYTTLTNWEKQGERYVPSMVRMVRYKQGTRDASDALFNFRNWKFDTKEMDPAFDVEKFTSENLPGEEFFQEIEKTFADDVEKKAKKS